MKRFAIVNAGHTSHAFTLIELLISLAVTALIILMVAQLMNSTTAVARTGNKHIDTDTQARAVLDRMALDFGRMLKRTDVDYYIKQPTTKYHGHSNGHGNSNHLVSGQQLNDQIAFFSKVPGYSPPPGGAQSPLSLVAYRVNNYSGSQSYLQLQRMGKSLLWNGVSNSTSGNNNNPNIVYPIVFLPGTIDATGPWSAAVNNDSSNNHRSQDPDYETIGPGVFRFEYYYLLKNGKVTDAPWATDASPPHDATWFQANGLTDIQAIAVAIAVIDPANRALIPTASLFEIADDMADFKTAPGHGFGGAKKIGDMEIQWNDVVQSVATTGRTSSNSLVPAAAASAIRIYNRYIDLRNF
jgi:prepilin-type N-terminal cleavage/methylation domain-containing protein